jgi:hypothetical protein
MNYKTISIRVSTAIGCLLLATGLNAQQPPKIQVISLEKLDMNDGLISDEIAKRFNLKVQKPVVSKEITRKTEVGVAYADAAQASPGSYSQAGVRDVAVQKSLKVDVKVDRSQIDELRASVEDRIKGAFASTLAQELSATKLMQLAVRDKSLDALKKEWQVSEELGKPAADAGGDGGPDMSVQQADYIAYAKINDFVTDRKVFGSEEAAIWTNSISATLEITKVNGGTKKVITETVSDGGRGRRGVGGEAANFNAQQIQNITQKLSKRLAERILDNYSPPKVIAHRGALIIMDRGEAAGVKIGDTYKIIERVDSTYGTDAGFPFGNATVEFVNEDTANLRLDPSVPDFGPDELSKLTLQKNTK